MKVKLARNTLNINKKYKLYTGTIFLVTVMLVVDEVLLPFKLAEQFKGVRGTQNKQ